MKKMKMYKAALAALTCGVSLAFAKGTPNITNFTLNGIPTICQQRPMPTSCNYIGANVCTVYTAAHIDKQTFYQANASGTCIITFRKA